MAKNLLSAFDHLAMNGPIPFTVGISGLAIASGPQRFKFTELPIAIAARASGLANSLADCYTFFKGKDVKNPGIANPVNAISPKKVLSEGGVTAT